jgi:hypothetical protein
VLGLVLASQATMGVAAIAFACLLAILARITQFHETDRQVTIRLDDLERSP